MFREQRRKKNIIDIEVAKELLLNEKRAVIAMHGDDGYPYAIPIDYIYDPDANRIYFHGAKIGHKVDSIKANDKVCFTVYGNETFKEDSWAPYLQSTVVFGRCHLVTDMDETLSLVKNIGMRYYPTEEEVDRVIAAEGKAVQVFVIEIEHMSGKQIHEI